MAQSQTESDAALLDKIDALSSLDTEDTRSFVSEALDEVRDKLEDNRKAAASFSMNVDETYEAEPTVDDVLDPDNVESIKVRARPFENPRVTVWLKGTRPAWANDAWTDTFYPHGLNAYNGKVQTTFDVRPF